ncbi:MAG: hypothetical protein JSU72_06625 [Deltaproteobacteria bacterium]|nr:MAG: hypothetical protein JSU72_06625 [Deltaproteobacteria bacterium]
MKGAASMVVAFLVGLSVILALDPGVVQATIQGGLDKKPVQNTGAKLQIAISIGEDDDSGNPAKSESVSTSEPETSESDKGKSAARPKNSKAPFKDFKPSEKIAADSAVDFPADI